MTEFTKTLNRLNVPNSMLLMVRPVQIEGKAMVVTSFRINELNKEQSIEHLEKGMKALQSVIDDLKADKPIGTTAKGIEGYKGITSHEFSILRADKDEKDWDKGLER